MNQDQDQRWTTEVLARVEKALSDWVPGEAPAGLGAAMRYGVLDGGKRLRALLVMGVSQPHWDDKLLAIVSIALASFTVGLVLYLSHGIERLLGDQGLQIVSRLMGLFVCALAAQIIFTGIKGYLVL